MYNSSLAPDVVKTAIDLVFDEEYSLENVPGLGTAEAQEAFRQDTTDRQAVIIDQFQGPGYFEVKAEEQDVPQSSLRVGNQKTFAVVNYEKEVDISKNLMDDDQHSTIDMLVRKFARNAKLTQDKYAYGQFAGGFSAVTTNDGAALFATTHTTLGGQTVSNLETAAISDGTINTLFNDLILQKTQDGTLGGHTAECLIVPTLLFKQATELTKSELKAAVNDNDLNYYSQLYPGLKVYHSPFLGSAFGYSDTAFFLASRYHSMYRWVREAVRTDLIDWRYQRNNNYIYKAGYREVVGPISYEGLVATNGTTAAL